MHVSVFAQHERRSHAPGSPKHFNSRTSRYVSTMSQLIKHVQFIDIDVLPFDQIDTATASEPSRLVVAVTFIVEDRKWWLSNPQELRLDAEAVCQSSIRAILDNDLLKADASTTLTAQYPKQDFPAIPVEGGSITAGARKKTKSPRGQLHAVHGKLTTCTLCRRNS